MSEPSGRAWCARYPTSTSVDDLVEPFRSNVKRFIEAIEAAGGTVTISATYRPPERAYLMHSAWQIARLGVDPHTVPAHPGVDIDWTHGGDVAAARSAAREMVAGYGIRFQPSLTSHHCIRRAIDMTIRWDGTLAIRNAAGTPWTIGSVPHDGTNPELAKIGASFGVIKLATDPPHWSVDGH